MRARLRSSSSAAPVRATRRSALLAATALLIVAGCNASSEPTASEPGPSEADAIAAATTSTPATLATGATLATTSPPTAPVTTEPVIEPTVPPVDVVDVAALASPGCSAAPPPPGETTLDFTASDMAGTYIRRLPPGYDGTTPMPVVFGLHGWSQPAALLGVQSQLGSAGDAAGFVTVLPDITRTTPLWDTALDGADVAWFARLLDSIEQTLCIDTNRVFVAGMSNGAMMASTLACTMSDRIAAIAPVAGIRLPTGCAPGRAVPIIAFHGTDDQYLAFDGGYGDKVAGLATPDGSGTLGDIEATGPDASTVPERIAAWAELNSCATGLTTDIVAADVTRRRPTGCDTPTELYVVDGGGHTWPGSAFDQTIGDFVGPVTTSIDATALMIEFFLTHPLR